MAVDWKERQFKSGPWVGKTYGEALQTEEGRDKLRAMIENVPDSSSAEGLKFWYKGFSKWAKGALSAYSGDPSTIENPPTQSPDTKEMALQALNNTLMDHEVRLKRLEGSVGENQKSVSENINWDD